MVPVDFEETVCVLVFEHFVVGRGVAITGFRLPVAKFVSVSGSKSSERMS